MFKMYDDVPLCRQNGESASLSVLSLFQLTAISLLNIPILGNILYVCTMISIASDHETAPSICNYAKVSLYIYFSVIAMMCIMAIILL